VDPRIRVVVFDLDGTLLDSDRALLAPFEALGVDVAAVRMGSVVGEECARLGVDLDEYVRLYDTEVVAPFPGVVDLLDRVDRWGVCSNKHPVSGHAELARLGWHPEVVMFTDSFGGGPKSPTPVLAGMGEGPEHAVFVGDSDHDRSAALRAGVTFALAGWNPRARAAPGDVVLDHPLDLLELIGR
jgi:HAD superfamily hydrolase (TIGR01549 family)